MKIGDLVMTRAVTAHVPARDGGFLQLGYKANKKEKLCLVFLGTARDGEDFAPEAVLREMGWEEKKGLRVQALFCPVKECGALWLLWPKELTGQAADHLNLHSPKSCSFCENASHEQLTGYTEPVA